jgi:hypothetical protein
MKGRAALALSAAALLTLAVVVMLNDGLSAHVGDIRIRVGDATRLLVAAAALSAIVIGGARQRKTGVFLIAVCGILALVAISRQARPTPPTGDFAVIESYIFQAMHGQLFLGPYSRFQWHHPGPIYFFILAPFYVLSGFRTAGVAAAALAINLGSIAALSFVCLRAGRGSLAVVATSFALVYAARFEAMLPSQWNPHVLVLPSVALIGMAAAVAAGWIELLPLVAIVAACAVQTHLGLLPTIAAVVAASLVAAFVASGFPSADLRAGSRTKMWRMVNISLWITFALWFLPLADELAHTPGNLTKLWAFFLSNRAHGQPFGVAFQAWAGGLTGLFRPGFIVAWGGQFVGGVSLWAQVWAVAQVALLIAIALDAARHRQADERFRSALAALLALGSIVALWSVTRIEGDIIDHEIFWISGLGILNAAVIVDAILGPWLGRRVEGPVAATACFVVFLVVVFLGVSQLELVDDRSFRPGDDEVAAETLSGEIVRYVRDQHVSKVLLDIDGPAWAVAAGVVVQLEKAHIPFAVVEDAVWMFGDATAPRGDEARTIAISREAHHEQIVGEPGTTALTDRRGFFADVIQ